jgi:hypothetical protein
VFAIVERGVLLRPELAQGLRCRAELRLTDGYPPVRVTFSEATILVEDVPVGEPGTLDVVVEGVLAEIVAIMATPTLPGGVPKLTHPHGRSTVVTIVAGRVRLRGNLLRARELARLLRI